VAEKRFLTVLAHPDDESFGPGGTLAKYARAGVDVHIAIATDGAAGSVIEEYNDRREKLVEIRTAELEKAVNILGGTLHMLCYRDSGYVGDPANDHPQAFVQVDKAETTGRIVELIRTIRPQVIMTHDETGGYFHPDHIRCYEITTTAFHAAGDPAQFPDRGSAPYQPQRLYYSVFPNRYLKFFILLMRLRGQDPTRVGRNNDIDFTNLGRPDADLHAHIDIKDVWDIKRQASAEHQSQGGGTGGFAGRLPVWLQKRIFGKEYFMRGFPPAPDGKQETDLFGG
jgi:LmbE family N-acetylglucosaminyl deacetylase